MKSVICEKCGGNDFYDKNGLKICRYCGTKYEIKTDKAKKSEIAIDKDIEMLLQKCQKDPRNAYKYAGLILDIDPTNDLALKYLK